MSENWRVIIGQSVSNTFNTLLLTSDVPWKSESEAVMVNLGDVFPDFKVDTSQGEIQFHEYIKDS